MRLKKAALAVATLSCFLTAGCFDIEQTLTLERNMSGKAGFSMKVNMEPMAAIMAQMKRGFEGKEGPPTPAEIEAARKDFASSKTTSPGDFEQDKKDMQSKLPKGVTLLESSFKEDGLKMAVGFTFGFDQLSKLNQIKFPKGKDPNGSGSPVDSPFGGLQVTDEGKTILVMSTVENPIAEEQSQMGPPPADPEAKKQIDALLGGLRVAFKITAPFQILEQNAHRKEGNTLIWEFTIDSFQKMTPAQLKQGIKVRYQK